MFCVYSLDLLDFIVTAHEDARSVMNMFRYDVKHALHLVIHSLATR